MERCKNIKNASVYFDSEYSSYIYRVWVKVLNYISLLIHVIVDTIFQCFTSAFPHLSPPLVLLSFK